MKFNVTGMSCAACSSRVEKAVSKVQGVDSVSVNLLTNSMLVEGDVPADNIIEAVEKAGYGAEVAGSSDASSKKTAAKDSSMDETRALRRRFVISLIFLAPLMYMSMGHMMWDWPLPGMLGHNHVAMGLAQMLLTIIIMIINQKFFVSGIKAVINGAPNMDTLVALGAGASFIYSVVALFMMSEAMRIGDADKVMSYMHEFYFESAAMILTLITLGKTLEAYSKGKTTSAIKSLMELAPKMAVVERDGREVKIPAEQVMVGDVFILRAGESVPVDGVVLEGSGAVDEAALTGESIPVDKVEGDTVSAATINKSGYMKCRATRVGEDTTLSKIIQMVSDAAAGKAPIAKIADKVSGIFVPTVIIIAVVTIIVWMACGSSFGFALARGVSVLVISCPCALGLATPVAIMVGNGKGAGNGILFKTAAALEAAGKVKTVVLDKTGTITSGHPTVMEMVNYGVSEEKLLSIAFSIEKKSAHPLAEAIVNYGMENDAEELPVDNFNNITGSGVEGMCEGENVRAGSIRYIKETDGMDDEAEKTAEKFAKDGMTPLAFTKGGKLIGIIAVADVIKEDSPMAVRELQGMGIEVVMLTGDNKRTADAVGKMAGVDRVIAGVMPEGKEAVVRELKEKNSTAMVGDGINDAPALTTADVGIAIGAGTDVAIDAADVVLMKSTLADVPAAIRLSRLVLRNIHENLFWAFIYNIIGIPLAAGIWYPIFGIKLNPMFGAAAMSLSSFCVVTNALRLNFAKIYGNNKGRLSDKNQETNNNIEERKEKNKMEKTMEIKGMMCGHCEARVKKCLEELPEVKEAVVSHEKGTAVVTLNSDISDDVLKKAVEEQDYEVKSIK